MLRFIPCCLTILAYAVHSTLELDRYTAKAIQTSLRKYDFSTMFLLSITLIAMPTINDAITYTINLITAWHKKTCIRRNNSEIIQYLDTAFSHAEELIPGMADANLIISGSRSLDFFVPGSCADDSDWDLYTFENPICIGRSVSLFHRCGVNFNDIYHPIRQLLDAEAPLVITIGRDNINEIFHRLELEILLPEMRLVPTLMRIRDEVQADENDRTIAVGEHGILRIAPARQGRSQYSPSIKIITGHTTHKGTNHKVQLISSKGRTPLDLIMAFHSSAVQCCITPYGAAHLYYDLASKKIAHIWPANTQYRPGADAAMTKYNDRGWTFVRPPQDQQQNRLAKQLTGAGTNGSKVKLFSIPLDLPYGLEAARRRAFEHLAWQECNGATSILKVVPKDLRDAMAAATFIRKANHSAGRIDAAAVRDARRGIRHSTAFHASTVRANNYSRIKLPEELPGL